MQKAERQTLSRRIAKTGKLNCLYLKAWYMSLKNFHQLTEYIYIIVPGIQLSINTNLNSNRNIDLEK